MNKHAAMLPRAKPAPRSVRVVYPGGVSLVVCTYNRRTLVARLLDSILEQLPVDYPIQLVVVDNNSIDDTAAYLRELAEGHVEVDYVLETKQGLSHARNAGAAAARHDFLLYLDDDAVLPPHYLEGLGALLEEHEPDFLGGPVYPLYADPKPDWFPESLEVRKKAKQSGFHNDITLSGGNYGVRRKLLAELGGFNPEYGMIGGKTGMLEERLVIEAYRRTTAAEKQKVYYSLDHFILHHTPKTRMTLKFQLKRIFIADYQYIEFCLEQGVRTPALLLSSIAARMWHTLAETVRAAPRLWRERREQPERPTLALVKLTLRAANLAALLRFLLTDLGQVRRRRLADHERRPLRVALLLDLSEEKAARQIEETPELAAVIDALNQAAEFETISVQRMSNDQIRAAVAKVNLRAVDLILTDNPKAAQCLAAQRLNLPHLQIVIWARSAEALRFLAQPRALLRHPRQVFSTWKRTRERLRLADQVVCTLPSELERVATLMLPLRRRVRIAIAGAAETPEQARTRMARDWGKVLAEASLWAPYRLPL